MNTQTAHRIEISHEPPSQRHGGALVLNGGHRARCSCGWWSDCYAQLSDTRRAIEVHLQRSQRLDFDALIEKSSIGAGIADIKKRGIDAHLADLARHWRRFSKKIDAEFARVDAHAKQQRKKSKSSTGKLSPEDAAFMRGFGTALASIWRCHHDGQMVTHLIKQNNFKLSSFRGVGMLDSDYKAICKAVHR